MQRELNDIEREIDQISHELSQTPDDHPNVPLLLARLGVSHDDRFDCLDEPDDLGKAIEYTAIAFSLIPDDDPRVPRLLSRLGCFYNRRFQRLSEADDSDKAIQYMSLALSFTPEGQPELSPRLSNLAGFYGERFGILGELEDLEKAIKYESRALLLASKEHPGWSNHLANLGASYSSRFGRLGELDDLEKAIEYQSQALASTPSDHPHRPSQLGNLGLSYKHRYKRLGELSDLDKAIGYESQALELTPHGHPHLSSWLSQLSLSHGYRFDRLGNLGDLEKEIEYQNRALALIPNGHPDLPNSLSNLGVSLKNRSQHLGDLGDLDTAIGYQTRAVDLTPNGHPNLPDRLTNLGTSHGHRFQWLGELVDLKKAIEYQCRALALIPDDYPTSPLQHFNLALSLLYLYEGTNELAHLQASLDGFRKASQSSTGAPRDKFKHAFWWAKCASKHSSLNCIEAYQTAIDLLPQFIWLGATTSQRYQDLTLAENLAVNAAYAAILSSNYKLALEWLEHARCIVWNQSLMLRSPLDELHSSHPTLASRLQTLAAQLHHASSESREARALSSGSLDPEKVAQQHRHLAKEYEDAITQVRKLPGFESFLRPIKANSLVRAAQNGPIVVINCHTDCCDALLILPGRDDIVHVPLPNFNQDKAQRARSEMDKSLGRKGLRERGFRVRQEPGHKDEMHHVLTILWHDIVKPVLDVLGYMNNTSTDSLPHIIWCPTGALSFLPLHAAGDYDQPDSRVFNYAISSYTPTLAALLSCSPNSLSRDCQVLAIGLDSTPGHNPLPGTATELAYVQTHSQRITGYTQLMNSQATITAVLDAMEQHGWVHLACHAHQNIKDPTKSGFFLHDGTLELAAINRRLYKNKGLAYLSACQTATGDEKLPDEVIHLASGMLMAGYSSVIATMWSVIDRDAPLVADKVYGRLMEDGKVGNGEAGKALHYAVKALREKVGEKEFGRWVPYIHVGS